MNEACRNALLAVIVALGSGCASITGSEVQNLSLTVKNEKNEAVTDAKCSLKNDKGNWQANGTTFVDVRRSSEDLLVECKKEGFADGFLRAISRAAGGMFGNIIFGGGIGAIIDHTKGTGYNYPDNLLVVMGQSNTVDRAQQAPESEKTTANVAQTKESPASEKPLTGAEVKETLNRRGRTFRVNNGPGSLEKITFNANGYVDLHFSNAYDNLYVGTYSLEHSSGKICIQAHLTKGLMMPTVNPFNDCFAVTKTADGKLRFRANDKTEFIAEL